MFIFKGFVFPFFQKIVYSSYKTIRDWITGAAREERLWLEKNKALLLEYKNAHSTAAKRLGEGISDGQLASLTALQRKQINSLSFKIAVRRVRNVLSVALPMLFFVACAALLATLSSMKLVLRVEYAGKDLGYIENERVFDAAAEQLENKIISVNDRFNIIATPLYTVEYVSEKNLKVQDADKFADTLFYAVMGDEIEEACGVYIDGSFTLAVKEEVKLKEFMESLLSAYHTEGKNATIGFLQKIEYVTGMYPKFDVSAYSDATARLGYSERTQVSYTCVKGDTVKTIAEKNGLKEEAFLIYNPDIEGKISTGKKITVTLPKPYLQVRVAERVTYNEPIPYETTIKYSSSYYEGYTETTTKGAEGVQKITADIIYVDGIEVSREIIGTEVTKKPRSEVKLIGTKSAPKTAAALQFNGVTVTGKFMWPVDGGEISCGWLGYPGHYGLDIHSQKGTAIYAADGGIVVEVKRVNYSYGYQLVIDHGNGYKTRYAHNSKILVEVGDKVKKGQKIAEMGKTGNATGNHLHFEIMVNGQRVNPKNYIMAG